MSSRGLRKAPRRRGIGIFSRTDIIGAHASFGDYDLKPASGTKTAPKNDNRTEPRLAQYTTFQIIFFYKTHTV